MLDDQEPEIGSKHWQYFWYGFMYFKLYQLLEVIHDTKEGGFGIFWEIT